MLGIYNFCCNRPTVAFRKIHVFRFLKHRKRSSKNLQKSSLGAPKVENVSPTGLRVWRVWRRWVPNRGKKEDGTRKAEGDSTRLKGQRPGEFKQA